MTVVVILIFTLYCLGSLRAQVNSTLQRTDPSIDHCFTVALQLRVANVSVMTAGQWSCYCYAQTLQTIYIFSVHIHVRYIQYIIHVHTLYIHIQQLVKTRLIIICIPISNNANSNNTKILIIVIIIK